MQIGVKDLKVIQVTAKDMLFVVYWLKKLSSGVLVL